MKHPLPHQQPQSVYRTIPSHRLERTWFHDWKLLVCVPILILLEGITTNTICCFAPVATAVLFSELVVVVAAGESKSASSFEYGDSNDEVIDFDDITDRTEIDDEKNENLIDLKNDHNQVDEDDNNNRDKYDKDVNDQDDFIQTFHSIDEVYHRLQEQQQQQQTQDTLFHPPSSIYWVMLLLQDDDACRTGTTPTLLSPMVTLYHDAAQFVRQWNHEWYPNDTTSALDTNRSVGKAILHVPYIHVGQLYLQSDSDKEIIISQLGIVTTPTIVLISTQIRSVTESHNNTTTTASEYGPIYAVEYTGVTSTSIGMAQGIRHYFDTISDLRSQHSNTSSTFLPNATSPLVLIEPRHFPSILNLQQYIRTYYQRLLGKTQTEGVTSNRLVLSKEKTSPEERLYINWLLDDTVVDDDFVLLIVQCRIPHPPSHDSSSTQLDWYNDFDTMARTLQARRDKIFFVVQQSSNDSNNNESWCTCDGSVFVYEIPNQPTNHEETRALLSKPPEEWATIFVSYHFDTSAELTKYANHNDTKGSRLVEFLVKVCSDTVMWFDRQVVAPIAFPTYRKIHAVLFIDMHHELMHIATETYQHIVHAGTDSDEQFATNTTPLLDDNPRSLMNRRSVTDFRRACRTHRLRHKQSLINDDMVCLIIPSTETRILTTFGVTELWTNIDDAIESFRPEILQQHQERNDTLVEHMVLPRLLITNQRYGGTRRYYKDLVPVYMTDTSSDSNPILDYITKFWNDELESVVKSGITPMNEINQYGVYILTANTIISKLYNQTESKTSTHALVLFTTSTCGHCKRITTIWNRLSHLLRTMGWDTLLQVYQMDVSENDVMNTPLNVTVKWVPDVYYLSPDRTKRIRYSMVDELGDTIGSVRDPLEIIDWLIHEVGNDFIDNKGIEQLLSDLENMK